MLFVAPIHHKYQVLDRFPVNPALARLPPASLSSSRRSWAVHRQGLIGLLLLRLLLLLIIKPVKSGYALVSSLSESNQPVSLVTDLYRFARGSSCWIRCFGAQCKIELHSGQRALPALAEPLAPIGSGIVFLCPTGATVLLSLCRNPIFSRNHFINFSQLVLNQLKYRYEAFGYTNQPTTNLPARPRKR